ncbi:MAG: hypothetical protein R2684_04835 [Pyrinomonadaceae bacterium]
MSSFTNPLDSVRVASPCSADWESMIGNERQRFCGQCKMNVYNLSAMTKDEAENLITGAEGRLCARFYRRPDGTILTKDCPVGWAAVKKRVSRIWTAVAAMAFTMFASIGIVSLFRAVEDPVEMGAIPVTNQNYKPETGEVAPYNPDDNAIMGGISPAEDSDSEAELGKMEIVR